MLRKKHTRHKKECDYLEHLLFSLNATVPIFILMVLGYLLKISKVVDEPFVKTLNSFNYKITLPVLLFRDIAESNFYEVWDTAYVLYCFFATLASIVIIWILTALLYKNKACIGEFVQGSYRSSAAVLGIAFIQNIYGNAGMAPLMIIGTVPLYNIAAVIILTFTRPGGEKPGKNLILSSLKGIITNPIIIGILLGMGASILQLKFPPIVAKPIGSISSLATPLALIGLGAGFEGAKAIKKIRPTIVATLLKLMVLPLVFLPLAVMLGFRDEKLVAALIMLGAPTTVSCYIMAKNMGHEGVLTSGIVVATTFFSSVSLTFWLFILKSQGMI